MVSITTEVDAYLEDFEDEDLIEELKDRGYYVNKSVEDCRTTLDLLYEAWVYKTGDYEDLFRKYCQQNLGRSF